MTAMDEPDLEREGRTRRRKFVSSLAGLALGGVLTALGFAFAEGRSGDEAIQAGIMTAIGVGLMFGAAMMVKTFWPGDRRWRTETRAQKRERLQAKRTRQLWLLPVCSVLFLFQGTRALGDLLSGQGGGADYFGVAVPVLYAWFVSIVVMGWDELSRSERRFMEDELTRVLRARAIGAAFVVLMGGTTVALGLALWSPRIGILAIPFMLVAAGATAGIRFAWLDREAGQDG